MLCVRQLRAGQRLRSGRWPGPLAVTITVPLAVTIAFTFAVTFAFAFAVTFAIPNTGNSQRHRGQLHPSKPGWLGLLDQRLGCSQRELGHGWQWLTLLRQHRR